VVSTYQPHGATSQKTTILTLTVEENLKSHKIWNGRYSEELLPYINSRSVNSIVALTWTGLWPPL